MKAEFHIPAEFTNAVADAVLDRLRPFLKHLSVPSVKSEELMSVEKLAAYLGGVSKDWIYHRTANHEIPFVKVGHLVKFRRLDIDRWISTQSAPVVTTLSAPFPGRRTRDCESRDTGETPCVIDKV